MISSFDMSTASVVIITGTIPRDLKAAAEVLAYFIGCGCKIQSNLHGTTFLYTLVNHDGGAFYMHKGEYLKTLEGIERSADFSVTYA